MVLLLLPIRAVGETRLQPEAARVARPLPEARQGHAGCCDILGGGRSPGDNLPGLRPGLLPGVK